MREALLPEADRDLAHETVVEVLRALGAHVPEATHSHVRFADWNPKGQFAFARSGYVGLHGHAGERTLRLRVLVRAAGPRRALVAASAVGLVAAVLLFAIQPTPTWWIVASALLWPPWIATLVVDLSSRRETRESENRLYARLVEELRARGETVLTEDEMRRQEFEREVEAEVVERRLRQGRSAKR